MIKIGGLQKTTFIDYPGKLACTVFLCGCNFRCPFCYSRELVLPEKIKNQPKVKKKEFFNFLQERKGLLEAVVVCGGEPTINEDLPDFIKEIKKFGYLIKLDTNGSNPEMLKELINEKLIDYVAMDIKAPIEKYEKTVRVKVETEKIKESVKILKKGIIGYEFRTTVVPGIIDKDDVLKMAKWLSPAQNYFLQNFKAEKTIDPKFEKIKPYSDKYIEEIKKAVQPYFKECEIR